MPELPEVHTTCSMLNRLISGLIVRDVWSEYDSVYYRGKPNIKNKDFFTEVFKPSIVGARIDGVARRGKNVFINLSNGRTIIVHMKMTGHLLYGKYKESLNYQLSIIKKRKEKWMAAETGALQDSRNQFIRLIFSLSDEKHLALSDMRRFATVTVAESANFSGKELSHLGPEPLSRSFTFRQFDERLNIRPRGRIKQVLMDQSIIAGIGNIYSDEMLWISGIHPLSTVFSMNSARRKRLFLAMRQVLRKGIRYKGDSMSDYRNPLGVKGGFQTKHEVYGRKGGKCRRCKGVIERIMVGGRSAHFCPLHQK